MDVVEWELRALDLHPTNLHRLQIIWGFKALISDSSSVIWSSKFFQFSLYLGVLVFRVGLGMEYLRDVEYGLNMCLISTNKHPICWQYAC